MASIEQHLQSFLEYLEIERGRSLLTVRNYDHYLRDFFRWSKIREPKEMTESLVKIPTRAESERKPRGGGLKIHPNYYVIATVRF